MRKFLALALSSLMLVLAFEAIAKIEIRRDPGDAWPWGAEVPFPWKGIQGVWKTEIDGKTVYFSFRTLRAVNSVKQLQIAEYLSSSCELIAHGAGYEEDDRVVNALMIDRRSGQTFDMSVHVFRQADLKGTKNPQYTEVPGAKTVTVMNIGPTGRHREWESYQLHKVASNPAAVCRRHLETDNNPRQSED